MPFTNSTRTEPPPPLPWIPLLTLSAATYASVTAEMMPAGLLPTMSTGLGTAPSRIGLLVSCWAVAVAVTSLPLVRATADVARSSLLTISLTVFAVAVLGTAISPSYGFALTSRIAAAVAHGLFWSVVVGYSADLLPEVLIPRAIAIVLAGPTVAAIGGVPVTTLLADQLGWRVSFAVVAVLLGVAALLVRVLLPPGPVARPQVEGSSTWDASALRVMLLAVAAGLLLVGHFAVYTYVVPLLTGSAGLGTGAVAPALLLFGVAGGAGVLMSGRIGERWPRAALRTAALLLGAAMATLLLLPGSGRYAVALLLPWGLSIGLLPPVFQATVLRTAFATFRPAAGGVVVVTLNSGIAAGALLGGRVLDGPGLPDLPLIALIPVALGLLLLIGVPRASTSTPQAGA